MKIEFVTTLFERGKAYVSKQIMDVLQRQTKCLSVLKDERTVSIAVEISALETSPLPTSKV